MMTNPTNTVSLLTNTFFCDTLPSRPVVNPPAIASTLLPINRALLDMPNVIPETEAGDEPFYWDDVAG